MSRCCAWSRSTTAARCVRCPSSFSLIAIHKHGLRHEFAQEAIDEAHRVAKLPLDPPRDGEGDRLAKLSGGGGGVQGSDPLPSGLRTATSPSRGGAEREDLTH